MRCGDEEVSDEDEEEEEDDDDDDDDECVVCCGADSQPGNEMLLCDRRGCDGAYHQQCLRPAVRRVPEGAWHCPTCAAGAKLVRAQHHPSPRRSSFSLLPTPPPLSPPPHPMRQ